MSDERGQRRDVVVSRGCWRLLMTKLIAAELLCRMVWVDETALWVRMPRRYGRAPRGRRAWGRSRLKPARYTLVAAMSQEGVIVSRLIPGAAKLEGIEQFMRELVPQLEEGSIVQWDNLKEHHHEALLAWVRAQKIGVVHQPPYSPESNPIEEMFSSLKTWIRSRPLKGVRELREALAWALAQITPEHRKAWIAHAVKNVLAYPPLEHLPC